MASNQLKPTERASVNKALDLIFGRVVPITPCPLSDARLRHALVESWLPNDLFLALRTMRKYDGQQTAYLFRTNESTETKFVLDGEEISVSWSSRDSDAEDSYVKHFLSLNVDESHPEATSLTQESINAHLSAGDAEALTMWLRDTWKLAREVSSAHLMLENIVAMAATAGQLRRMVPELEDFMPPPVKARLQEQKRASQLPFGWDKVDRPKLWDAVAVISKCYLMADCSFDWDNRTQYRTWMIVP